jgi:hypothetical protein
MTNTQTSRFGPIFKKIKEKPGERSDEFDPTLEENEVVAQWQKPVKKKRKQSKKDNPDYTQTTAYIRSKIYDETRKRLIDEGRKRDYSDLMNDLLSEWLNLKNAASSKY